MPTPSERIQKVVDSYSPSQVVFRAVKSSGESIVLEAVVTQPASISENPSDQELQEALGKYIQEQWDPDNGKFFIPAYADVLWEKIKNNIVREYESTSRRCEATKRKTLQFIRDIKIDDRFLPDYLIQVFLKISSPKYNAMTAGECEALFEQFESLRRTYGKRNR